MRTNMTEANPDKRDEQFHSLLETVERLRKEHFPHLDRALVRDLLRLHADISGDAKDLSRNVEDAVEQRLATGI